MYSSFGSVVECSVSVNVSGNEGILCVFVIEAKEIFARILNLEFLLLTQVRFF